MDSKFFLAICCCFSLITGVGAQSNTGGHQKATVSWALGLQRGFIFAHSEAVQNTKGANPNSIEAKIAWQRTDSAVWNLCNCYPRKGITIAYYDFNTPILGSGFSATYFLEPVYKLSSKLSFSFRAAAGLVYMNNKFDSTKNPANQSYSTALSMHTLVGLGLWYKMNDNWSINASFNYQHTSNGGLKQPNKGVNFPTAGLLLSYQKQKSNYYSGVRTRNKHWKGKPWRWDATVFGIARRSLNGTNERLLLLGLNTQAAKQVGRMNNITIGAEVYTDEQLRLHLKQDSISASPVKVGLMLGHEFILGKFLFTQHLGAYLFDQTPYYDAIYHRWGIRYRFNQNLGLGLSLKAHRHIAEFIDLRITYSFSGK